MIERIVNLSSPEDVSSFLAENPTSIIFMAGTCHKTMQGWGFLQEQLQAREDLRVGLIRVVEARAASNLVAQETGITHQSPQVILYRDGEAVFDVDNWNITPEGLTEGLAQAPYSGSVAPAGGARSDLSVYTGLLERYLNGELDDREFEFAYTTTFRDDASLRSREEVEVLGSIFGDVDRHMEMHMMMGGRSNSELVRQRAAAALEGLKTLSQTPA